MRNFLFVVPLLALLPAVAPLRAHPACEQSAPTPPVGDGSMVPLPVLGPATYLGQQGGLFPAGANEPPPSHRQALQAKLAQIGTLAGPVGLISLGFSNPTHEFGAFVHDANGDASRNPNVILVSASQGGQDIVDMISVDPGTMLNPYWTTVATKIAAAGLTPDEVRVAWIKATTQGPSGPFLEAACLFRERLETLLQIVRFHYPNLEICLVSSRIYGGYHAGGSPEPFAYEEGFAFKWLIEDQIAGTDPGLDFDDDTGVVPLVTWGPYIWANADQIPYDDLVWLPEDFEQNGNNQHPSELGEQKVADRLTRFFRDTPDWSQWWRGSGGAQIIALPPTDDTYVRVDDCQANFGDAPQLIAQSSMALTERAYVRFDLTGETRPLDRALLGLRVDPFMTGSGTLIEWVEGEGTEWFEESLTGCSEPLSILAVGATPSGYSRSSYLTIDVTPFVITDQDGIVSFRISPDTQAPTTGYLSKEYEVPGPAQDSLRFPPHLILVVEDPARIFSDDFETGDLSAWSHVDALLESR